MNENNETQYRLFVVGENKRPYARADMIRDGLLIDVSKELLDEMGILHPFGILWEVWIECVAWTDADSECHIYQEEHTRLKNLLSMFKKSATVTKSSTVSFDVACIPRHGKSREPEDYHLEGIIGPGDDGKPVITVILSDEHFD